MLGCILKNICAVLVFLNVCALISSLSTQEKNEKIAHFKRFISSKCSNKYTSNCLLLDLCKLIDSLSLASNFQILPGVFIVSNRSEVIPIDIFEQAVAYNQTQQLDVYVRKKLQTYLDSLSVSWKIMDRNSAFSVRQFSDELITELLPNTTMARGKKKNGKESVMWAAGAMAALGTSALFAITGKAAIASLAALMLSLICYFRGSGHSGYTAASQTAYSAPYKHQCTEAIIDVNGRGDHSAALMGYKKRTADDTWNYQRYAASMGDNVRGSEQPAFRENENSYSKLYTVNTK